MNGYPPSVREIGARVGLSSSSTVQSHLKSLEKRGLIHRDPTKPRALRSAGAAVRAPEFGVIPIIGKVAAGTPITASENVEGEYVVPAHMARRDGTFMLRGCRRLHDRRRHPRRRFDRRRSGARCEKRRDRGGHDRRRGHRETLLPGAGRVRLQPENKAMQPIFSDDVTIVGRVEAVIRTL